jgi:peptidoglycan/xylan/chitin deacetylase (PgdA/CDA1 family)
MLNYTNANRVFIALLMVSICLDIAFGITALVYAGLFLGYSALFFYGVYKIDFNFFIVSACSKETANKEIAISFDDGPGNYTLEILQILKKQQIKAAFFCIGKQIKTREDLFRQIHEQGHLIGNHSYSHHVLFDFLPGHAMLKDLQRMDAIMAKLIGLKPKLFRPPFGVTLPWMNTAVSRGGYLSVGWSVRSMDTVIDDENELLDKVMNSLKPGAIYLFHDTNATTPAILSEFIERVTGSGYRIVRLDIMLGLPAYQ